MALQIKALSPSQCPTFQQPDYSHMLTYILVSLTAKFTISEVLSHMIQHGAAASKYYSVEVHVGKQHIDIIIFIHDQKS
jgi:hypothetical protein